MTAPDYQAAARRCCASEHHDVPSLSERFLDALADIHPAIWVVAGLTLVIAVAVLS